MSNLSDKPWLVPGHMYQYDIGWLVDKLLSFETELNTAIDLKTIHYSDPIQWDITTQYSPNTVVVDPKTGTAYMSKVPVPAGVLLTNTDYWVVIFNYQRIYDKIMSGVAFNDKDNLNATKDLLVNDLVWYRGDLYRATRAIPKGTTYIPGTNLTPTTIADCLETYYGRDRVAHVINDTVNVSGNYTLNAGDIAETASHVTIHSTQDMLLDADGNLTEQVTGGKTTEVGGKLTEQVTGNREIDVDGDDSIHIDGVTSINRGGAVTEVYGSSVDKRVTGAFTEIFEDTATSTFNGKRIAKYKDVDITATANIDITTGDIGLHLPNGNLSLNATIPYFNSVFNIVLHGGDNTGVTPIDDVFDYVINKYGVVYFPSGTYLFTRQHVLTNQTVIGCGSQSKIKCTSLGLNGGRVNQYGGFDSAYNQILFKLTNGCHISNLFFDNLDGGGIVINGNNNKVNNCYISTKATITGSTGYYAITIKNSSNIVIDSITVNMEDGNNRDGIHIESNTDNVFISNCWIKAGDDGLAFNALEGTGGSIHDIYVSNCRVGGYGVRFFGEEHTTVYNIGINNCYLTVDSEVTQSGCIRFSNTTNTIGGTPIGDHGLFNNISITNCFLVGVRDINLAIYMLNSYVNVKLTNCVCYSNVFYENSNQTTFINFNNCLLNGLIVIEDTTGSNTINIANTDIIGIVKHKNSVLLATMTNTNINSTIDISGDNTGDVIKISNSLILPSNIILTSNGVFAISNTKTNPAFNITNGVGQYFITNLINHNGGDVIGNASICARIKGDINVNALPASPKNGDHVIIGNLIHYYLSGEWLKVNMSA